MINVFFSQVVAERVGLGGFFFGLEKPGEKCLFSEMQWFSSCSQSAAATALWNRLSFGFAHENQGEIWDRVKSAFLQVMDKLLFGLLASSVWQAEPSSFTPVTSCFPKSEIYILKQIYPKMSG